MSDLVGNQNCSFSRAQAQLLVSLNLKIKVEILLVEFSSKTSATCWVYDLEKIFFNIYELIFTLF